MLPTPTAQTGGSHPEGGHVLLDYAVKNNLPTPTASDATGTYSRMTQQCGNPTLLGAVSLLPTPTAADSLGGHHSRGGDRSDELLLGGVVRKLPTPTSRDWKGQNQRGDDSCLPGAVAMLPTPKASDGERGGDAERFRGSKSRGGRRSNLVDAAKTLLPTPKGTMSGPDFAKREGDGRQATGDSLATTMARLAGGRTPPPSRDGSESSEGERPTPSTPEEP